jgi:hypothetical protein
MQKLHSHPSARSTGQLSLPELNVPHHQHSKRLIVFHTAFSGFGTAVAIYQSEQT